MKEKDLAVRCALTEKQYREYMWFHVTGRSSDWALHLFGVVLVLAFAAVNFYTDSPILGAIFGVLGVYLLCSRYVRFFMSVNRIVKQYELGPEAKEFYFIRFDEKGLAVDNQREFAVYGWERVKMLYFREKQRIAYLYLTDQMAFLLPYDGFENGTAEDFRRLAGEKLDPGKIKRK